MIALFIYPLLLNFMQITSLTASFVDQNFELDNFNIAISIKARSLVRSRSKGAITIALEGKDVSNNNKSSYYITLQYVQCIA